MLSRKRHVEFGQARTIIESGARRRKTSEQRHLQTEEEIGDMGLKPIWSNKKRRVTSQRGGPPARRKRRSFLMEPLEPRQMLAGGPALQSILPNEGLDLLGSAPQSV